MRLGGSNARRAGTWFGGTDGTDRISPPACLLGRKGGKPAPLSATDAIRGVGPNRQLCALKRCASKGGIARLEGSLRPIRRFPTTLPVAFGA